MCVRLMLRKLFMVIFMVKVVIIIDWCLFVD